jgi:hypothetical protein
MAPGRVGMRHGVRRDDGEPVLCKTNRGKQTSVERTGVAARSRTHADREAPHSGAARPRCGGRGKPRVSGWPSWLLARSTVKGAPPRDRVRRSRERRKGRRLGGRETVGAGRRRTAPCNEDRDSSSQERAGGSSKDDLVARASSRRRWSRRHGNVQRAQHQAERWRDHRGSASRVETMEDAGLQARDRSSPRRRHVCRRRGGRAARERGPGRSEEHDELRRGSEVRSGAR